jgi:hypothetical protein
MVRGSNGSAYYLAFPAELLLAWYPRPIRAAAGASLSLAPRLHGSGFLGEANLELRDSLGLVGEVVWVLPFIGVAGSYSAGVRYLWQKLQAKAGGNSVDASAVGVVFGVSL